jgi:hypothetical protein
MVTSSESVPECFPRILACARMTVKCADEKDFDRYAKITDLKKYCER